MRVKMRSLKTHLMSSSCVVVRRRTRRALSSSVVDPRRHRISSLLYVDVTFCHVLLRVVVIVSCRCTLSSSSDKADHCFL